MRDDSARRTRWYPAVVVAVVFAILAAGTLANLDRNPQPRLVSEGFQTDSAVTNRGIARGSDPARTPAGSGTGRPAAHPGTTPAGGSSVSSELVRHAVADLDALTLPTGAPLAGANGPWRYVWPRDASFVAAARCSLGQYAEAARVLDFLDRIHPRTGRWEARYDERGQPVRDGREAQLDGSGWVLWATWFCHSAAAAGNSSGRSTSTVDRLTEYWPMVRESAEQIVAELGPDHLPDPSPDYWERPERELTLGTVAPLITGLRAAARIAGMLNRPEATSWRDTAEKLSAATDRHFGAGYPRTPARAAAFLEPGLEPIGLGGGADAIVTVLGPPFAPERQPISRAIERARQDLTLPNGGVTPGEDWRADGVAWTPQTTLFALSAAARGDHSLAIAYLTWLDRHRTSLGALPEKVNRDVQPAGEAPLAWTAALVVLTSAALRDRLPIP